MIEFEKFENASIDPNPFKRELSDIYHIINLGKYNIDKRDCIEKFWDMFIIDSLIGNKDRHNGNWGFIKNILTDELSYSPIYDCGSSLCSTLTDEQIDEALKDNKKMNDYIRNTSSAIKCNGKKIKYDDYILNTENKECCEALLRVFPRINLDDINFMINEIDCISDSRKRFYIKLIAGKYNQILKPTYKRLLKLENQIQQNNTEDCSEEFEQ